VKNKRKIDEDFMNILPVFLKTAKMQKAGNWDARSLREKSIYDEL